jgi:hypothetical protein
MNRNKGIEFVFIIFTISILSQISSCAYCGGIVKRKKMELEYRLEFFVVDIIAYEEAKEHLRMALSLHDWDWVTKTIDSLQTKLVRAASLGIEQYLEMKGMTAYFGTSLSEIDRMNRLDSIRHACEFNTMSSELIYSFAMEYVFLSCFEFYHTRWNYVEGIQLPEKMLNYCCPDIGKAYGNPEDYLEKWNSDRVLEKISIECTLNEIIPNDQLFKEICLVNAPIYVLPPSLELNIISRFGKLKNEEWVGKGVIQIYQNLLFGKLEGSKRLCAMIE